MDVLTTILQFLGILALVVLVHEFGHFSTAKAFGIKVNEFGLGFPPRLLGFRKGETVYTLNLLPLGGFVKLEGENDPSQPRSLASKGVGTRFIVLAAGPLMNAVLAIVLLAVLFTFTVGELRVAETEPGSPAALAGVIPGDTILEVNGRGVSSFDEFASLVGPNRGTEIEWLIRRGDVERRIRLVPRVAAFPEERSTGVAVDLVGELRVEEVAPGSPADLAGVLPGAVILAVNGDRVDALYDLTGRINRNRGKEIEWLIRQGGTERSVRLVPRAVTLPGEGATGIRLDIAGEVLVQEVAPGSPAAHGGIRPGDVILEVDGGAVNDFRDLTSRVRRSLGKEVEWLIQRGDEQQLIRLVPQVNSFPKEAATGIAVDFVGLQSKPVRAPWDATGLGFKFIWDVIVLTKSAVTDWIVDGGDTPLAGPVGIAQATGEVTDVAGLKALIPLAALFSISLAIFNILPIPALDGGRLMFVVLEWVRRGKRISPEKEGFVHLVGFAVLIAMLIAISYNDIMRIVEGQSLLR